MFEIYTTNEMPKPFPRQSAENFSEKMKKFQPQNVKSSAASNWKQLLRAVTANSSVIPRHLKQFTTLQCYTQKK